MKENMFLIMASYSLVYQILNRICLFTGHLAIPYYIKQKEEKLRKESEQMRIKCQSYIESGYYSDPR